MANVAHATLSGADLHEPKGIGTASANTVYVANGSGSGSWTTTTSLFSITGMVADFATPAPPSGWLECDGSALSRTTFAALFSALTIQQNGTRTNGSATIINLASVGAIGAGYFVSGTGIPLGATVVSVGAGSIVISAPCTSSGVSNVIVSPWPLGDGSTTFNLPNASTSGRYRRSRGGAAGNMGQSLADTVKNHTHGPGTLSGTVTGGTDNNSSNPHAHGPGTLATGNNTTSLDHTHNYSQPLATNTIQSGGNTFIGSTTTATTAGVNTPLDHVHNVTTGATATTDLIHSHSITGQPVTVAAGATAGNDVSATETRPVSIVVITCIKT